MFATSLDILYIVLAVIILLLGILLAIAVVYLIIILRDASKASFYIRDTAQRVNEFVYKPLMIANGVLERLGPVIEAIQEKGEEMVKKAGGKKKVRKKKK